MWRLMRRLMPAVALPLLAVGGLCLLLAAPGYAEEAQAYPFAGEYEVRSAAADGIKFRVIYPDQDGQASVAADIGALTPLEVWFGVDVGLGWTGVQMHYDGASGEYIGQLPRAHKPNVRTEGRLALVYSSSPDDTVYYWLPYSTEIGVFAALHTPNVMPDDLLQVFMSITTTEGVRWQYGAGGHLPIHIYVDEGPQPEDNLLDTGMDGDLRGGDGVFTGWTPVIWSGSQTVTFRLWEWTVAQIPFTVTTSPDLIVLTDFVALYNEFLDTKTEPEEDRDGNLWLDFYEALERISAYAARHNGIVYDLGTEVTQVHGYPVDYPFLDYDGGDNNWNRFRMMKEIDAMLAGLAEATDNSFHYLAIIGDDEAVPSYRRQDPIGIHREEDYGETKSGNVSRLDSGDNYILTDLPYATYDDADPETAPSPFPQVAVGRIFADHPDELIGMINSYDTPIRFGAGQVDTAFFAVQDDRVAWEWYFPNVYRPMLKANGLEPQSASDAPPTLAGHYIYWDPDLFKWRPLTVTHTISETDLTLIYSHGAHHYNQTPQGIACDGRGLCAEQYDAMHMADQHIFVNAGCHGGYAVAHQAAKDNFGNYDEAIANSLLNKHVVYVGNTVYGRGMNYAVEADDYLWTGFVNQLFNDTTQTVGMAWLLAWPGYWHTLYAADAAATTQAYGKALYGLPTQPIEHAPAALAVEVGEATGMVPAGSQTVRRLSLPVDIGGFEFEETPDGTLVRPGNGGGVLGVLGQPLMPQVIRRFTLPLSTSWVTITENIGARVTEDVGPIRLAVGTTALRCPEGVEEPRPVTAGLEQPFPAKSWSADFAFLPDALEVVLRIVPAQAGPGEALTLFRHMQFDLDVTLPALPVAISDLQVNDGKPVRAGQAEVKIAFTLNNDAPRSLVAGFEVWDAGGAVIGSASAPATFDAGSSRVGFMLDGSQWMPGSKMANVKLSDGGSGLVYDAAAQQFTVTGIQARLHTGSDGVAPDTGLAVAATVRTESGGLASGLSSKVRFSIDDKQVAVAVIETSPGVYAAVLPTTGLAPGVHTAAVQVEDRQGNQAKDTDQFGIGDEWVQATFLPALMK